MDPSAKQPIAETRQPIRLADGTLRTDYERRGVANIFMAAGG